ncbi:hypothetical protein SIL73_13070 [Acidithiobacillus thiooxidans]|uniref:hypothetical protein n=1 Tax=Acidithiobacillus thiooxidans TaxID=930 RepID=UPI0029C10D48|nr:hypothetical protein [Acidithiobacillus thiooxidans]MDX5935621.1 hypothetical protein [Acidithiobacillus thiooxidans]
MANIIQICNGKPYPRDIPREDCRVGLNLHFGFLTYEIIFKKPYDAECLVLDGLCKAITIFHDKYRYPYGLFGVLFEAKPNVKGIDFGNLYLCAPLIASLDQVRAWVAADTNIVMFVLIDADTGIVEQIRTIGLNMEILLQLKSIWGNLTDNNDSFARFNFLMESLSNSKNKLFSMSSKWIYNEDIDDFVSSSLLIG